jgi:hypothetical protein
VANTEHFSVGTFIWLFETGDIPMPAQIARDVLIEAQATRS